MGKVNWGTSAADIDNAEEFESDFKPYEGPVPPRGVYRVALKQAEKKAFGSGNNGVELLFEIAEPGSSAKAKYNGCPLWFYLVDTETGAGNIKNFMRAIGGSGRNWANTQTSKDDRDRDMVTKFGAIVVKGLTARAETRLETYEGEKRAKIQRFLPKADEPEPGDDSDDSGTSTDDGAPF
jgi:hypothetical protein